jgi:hypothetical protein
MSEPPVVRRERRARSCEATQGRLTCLIFRSDTSRLLADQAAAFRAVPVLAPSRRGEALRRSLREYVADPAARLLSRFGIHGIEATIRTLQPSSSGSPGATVPTIRSACSGRVGGFGAPGDRPQHGHSVGGIDQAPGQRKEPNGTR